MNEKALAVLDQYDLEIYDTYRTRGNYGCETATGKYILQEYNNSNEKMATMKMLYNYLEQSGFRTDYVIENKEGNFVSVSEDGYSYILKRWYSGEECNISNVRHICTAAGLLADFHNCCEDMTALWQEGGVHPGENMLRSFERHNREIVHIRNYIRKRKSKNFFEMSIMKIIDDYHSQSVRAYKELEESEYEKVYERALVKETLNHGNYNHHNIMFVGDEPVMIHLLKINYAPQIQDIYDFLRKAMEKNNWNIELGKRLMEAYDSRRKISETEYRLLKIMLRYPEKFWKIINYYYNSNKAWYSEKNESKLRQFQKQEELRWNFIEKV